MAHIVVLLVAMLGVVHAENAMQVTLGQALASPSARPPRRPVDTTSPRLRRA
jgi:hypothetical protein